MTAFGLKRKTNEINIYREISAEKLICEYEKLLVEKETVILEQSDIIAKQKDYIYRLLSEVESKTPSFSFKLGFAKLMNIIL